MLLADDRCSAFCSLGKDLTSRQKSLKVASSALALASSHLLLYSQGALPPTKPHSPSTNTPKFISNPSGPPTSHHYAPADRRPSPRSLNSLHPTLTLILPPNSTNKLPGSGQHHQSSLGSHGNLPRQQPSLYHSSSGGRGEEGGGGGWPSRGSQRWRAARRRRGFGGRGEAHTQLPFSYAASHQLLRRRSSTHTPTKKNK